MDQIQTYWQKLRFVLYVLFIVLFCYEFVGYFLNVPFYFGDNIGNFYFYLLVLGVYIMLDVYFSKLRKRKKQKKIKSEMRR